MAGSLNKACILGNVGGDPEIRALSNGSKVANFSVATTESWKDKDGEKRERTEWHRIVVWNEGLVGVVDRFVKKGSKVYIEGEMQTRKWFKRGDEETAENARYSTEIVLTGFGCQLVLCGEGGGGKAADPNGNASRPGNSYASAKGGGEDKGKSFGRTSRDLDDDIPF